MMNLFQMMVKHKSKILLTFLLAIVFNTFHDYFLQALDDKKIDVVLLEDLNHSCDKNVDIHKILHSPFLVLNNQIKIDFNQETSKNIYSPTLALKPSVKEIFKPPIFLYN
ncbi:hypothetical protein [Sulfurihydrogenibium subterraneum]|uniref:hypothetical protein n=1 Tax=Sulfurihydrogenibium subterraneum TaxID=171121 RepID=UPI00146FB0D4|nr:hypothetical protein [Sulfurihydrogenibium subterraneum]